MNMRVIGAILLIIGTCVGGSILALPLVTAGENILIIIGILLGTWVIMTLGAMLIVEVNLHYPGNANLISMAKDTLGKPGVAFTWLIYLLLLYSLLSAYMAGGTELVTNLLHLAHINIPNWLSTIIFLAIFTAIIYHGIRYIDWTNRGLMIIKLGSFVILLALLIPYNHGSALHTGHSLINPIDSIMPIVNSFGFAIIVPSLSCYLNKRKGVVRWTTIIGSLFPLVIYLAWIFSVQSSISFHTLMSAASSSDPVGQLANIINGTIHKSSVGFLSHVFVSICITTSFLGVSLSMIDFVTDGFQLKLKSERMHWGAIAISFIPPLMIVMLRPDIFIITLKLAGTLCVLLLILLPIAMAWSACHHKKIIENPPFYCSRIVLALGTLIAFFLLYLAAQAIF